MTCSVVTDLGSNFPMLEECGTGSPARCRWADVESTVADDDDNYSVAGLTLSSAPSLSGVASDIDDLEGVHEEYAPSCASARLFESEYLLSSEEEAMEYLANLRKRMESEAAVANRVVQRLWIVALQLEGMWKRPKDLRQEESKILQCAIQFAEPSFVHQAAAGLVELVEQQGMPYSTDISCLFKGNYSNFIVQELCKHAWKNDVAKLANALCPFLGDLAHDRSACRVVQRILENCSWEHLESGMFPTLLADFHNLCYSEYGGTVLTVALGQHPWFGYYVLQRIQASAAKHQTSTWVWEALIDNLPTEGMVDVAFQLLAQEGFAGLLLDNKGVHSLKAFARRPSFRQRLADELRHSPTLNRCRQKSYAKDLIKLLKI